MKHVTGMTLKLERARFLLSFAIVATGVASAKAGIDSFVSPNGNWNTAANWNPFVPTLSDTALILNGNQVFVPTNVSGLANSVGLGSGSGIVINGGSLYTGAIYSTGAGITNFIVVSNGGTLFASYLDLGGLGTATFDGATLFPTESSQNFFRDVSGSAVTITANGLTFEGTGYSVVCTNPISGGPLTVVGGDLQLGGLNNLGSVTLDGGLLQLGGLGSASALNGNPGMAGVINNGGEVINSAGSDITGGVGTNDIVSNPGPGADGLDLNAGAFYNAGTITGGGAASGDAFLSGAGGGGGVNAQSDADFVNDGSIKGGAGNNGNGGSAVSFHGAGTLTNTASGIIAAGAGNASGTAAGAGGTGVSYSTNGTLDNSGQVTGGNGCNASAGDAVTFNGSGTLNNNASGIIQGGGGNSTGLGAQGAGGTGVSYRTNGTLVNAGQISAGGSAGGAAGSSGVSFSGFALATNLATGVISASGGSSGISDVGAGGGTGLLFHTNGILVNEGSIKGGGGGSASSGGPGAAFSSVATVINSGTISGGTGSLNYSGSGFGYGGEGGAGLSFSTNCFVTNSGTLSGASGGSAVGGAGIQMNGGGVLYNTSLIQGGPFVAAAGILNPASPAGTGVVTRGAAATVINAGTIKNGISMGNYPNQLTVLPGSAISGGVNLGNSTSSQLIFGGAGAPSMASAVSGGVTMSGDVIVQGGGTWGLDMTLPGSNTTYINGSYLEVTNGGNLGFATTVNNGILQFNRSDVSTVPQSIGGTGSLQNLGSGTVILTGANTYEGQTLLDGGTLVVSNSGASITSPSSALYVGNSSAATLVVAGGAKVIHQAAYLAYNTGASGTVIVKDAGSQWISLNAINVGYNNTGFLTVEGGAMVFANGAPIFLGQNSAAASGTLQIGNGGAPGILDVPEIVAGQGTGNVIFNHASTNYYLTQDGTSGGAAVPLFGNLSVTQNSGTTALLATNTYSGVTTVNGGTLAINGLLNGGAAVAVNGGILSGAGTVTGTVAVGNGGGISPGFPMGTLSSGSETWSSGMDFNWNLGLAQGVAGTNWGLLQISGDLAINASNAAPIRISPHTLPGVTTGFNASNSASWTIATYTGNLTGFSSNLFVIDVSSFASETYAGHFYVSANVPHQLQLVFVPNFTPVIIGVTGAETNARSAVVETSVNTAVNPIQLTIQYGTNTSYGQTTEVQTIPANPKLATLATVIGGLLPTTTYHYRVALTWSGGTILGADATFTTTADATVFGVTSPGDWITATSTNSPAGQGVNNAIDGVIQTVYANDDIFNTGFTVFPSGRQVVTALTFISAPDHPEDDPSSFVLAGSDDGSNFVTIASNGIPPFIARDSIQSVRFANTTAYSEYQLTFPTVSNSAAATAMQVAEVEFLPFGEITSSSDDVSVTLREGASFPSGYTLSGLFDRQVGQLTNKFVLMSGTNSCQVDLTPALGSSVLKGIEMIGGSDDTSYPGRVPSSLTIEGTVDGFHYATLLSAAPKAATSNLEIQQFSAETNTVACTSYRITIGAPQSGTVVQLGELRLFGVFPGAQLNIAQAKGSVSLSWTASGYTLQSSADLSLGNWVNVTNSVTSANGTNSVTLPTDGASQFFRLAQ